MTVETAFSKRPAMHNERLIVGNKIALIYSYTMYTAGVFIPVIGGILWKGATRAGALSALIVGALVAIVGILTKVDIAGVPIEVCSAIISLVLFVVVSLFTKKKYEKNNNLGASHFY